MVIAQRRRSADGGVSFARKNRPQIVLVTRTSQKRQSFRNPVNRQKTGAR
jgi:hypothetical protein